MIDLRKLRHLVVLAKFLNYVRAAEELAITQPTLSRSIQALEQQLKVKLFDRDRGGVSLTAQGRFIVERATTLLAEAEDLESHTRLGAVAQGGRIRFGMAPMPARALLSKVLADRVRAAPNVTNEVIVRDVEPLWGMLVGGEIEFFVSADLPMHDLTLAHAALLGKFPLSLIVRAGHPLLKSPRDGAKYPLFRSSWAGLSIPDEARHLVLGPTNIVEDFATLAQLTASTDVMWIASAYAIQAEIRDGALVELLRGRQPIEVKMYTLARRSQSPLAKAVAAAFRHHIDRFSNDAQTASAASDPGHQP
jgi:DNA-binding transcriptional LysR family regulator